MKAILRLARIISNTAGWYSPVYRAREVDSGSGETWDGPDSLMIPS